MLNSPWQIQLLGGFSLGQRSRQASVTPTNQLSTLLAYMADRVGRQIPRNELLEELWPGEDDEASRNRFRVLLSAARRLLEPPGTPSGSILIGDRTMIGLSSEACRVDAEEFQRHIQKANQSTVREAQMTHFRAADELYKGEFLAGRSGDWVYSRRSFYARQQSLAQYKFSALLERDGDLTGAMHHINRAIEADPLREAPRRRALRYLVESGDIGAALAEYAEYRLLLKRSVGLVPTTELQNWIKGLKSWTGATTPKSRSEAAPDEPSLSETEELSPSPTQLHLPPCLTTFVGRATELVELSDLLPLYRWITLTGPGGIGKTRLAIETARANVELFGGGVFFVPVGESARTAGLLEMLSQQAHLEPSQEPLDQLRRFMAQPVGEGRNAFLFVLDGIDQLPVEANQVLLRLLAEIPNVTLLATARRRRGTPGEYEQAIGPLAMPDSEMRLDQLLANPSVQLFFERAQASSARFSVTRANATEVVALCRRLEGVPLAIELAAALARKVSPGSMLQQLGDVGALKDPKGWREPRHSSLSASLTFSLESLDPREQRLFCTLSVFRGHFEAAAAQIIAQASPDDLERLAAHSLLVESDGRAQKRYSMLDMVREFGWSRLSSADRREIEDLHAGYYRRLVADAANLHLSSGIQQQHRLRPELDNIHAAMDSFLNRRNVEATVWMAAGLVSPWTSFGYLREGREYIRRIRETLPVEGILAPVLNLSDGLLALFQEDAETGREAINQAIPELEAAGMYRQAAAARWALSYAAYASGDYDECLSQAQRMEPTVGTFEGRWQAYRLHMVGIALCQLNRLEEAAETLLDAQEHWQKLGDHQFVDFCKLTLSGVAWRGGEFNRAWEGYREAASAFAGWRDSRGLSFATEGMARVAADAGDYLPAVRLLGAAQRLRESIGLSRNFPDRVGYEAAAELCRSAIGAAYDVEWQFGYGISTDRIAPWLAGLKLAH